MKMLKPERLKKGDTIAIVSLSWGGLGDEETIHRYYLAKDRLENIFGLKVKTMPHALMGTDYIYAHPEARAKDLMAAFEDTSVDGIICAIGGDDTIRLIPFINYEIIRKNPKIFMGYSDTTVNHFMMNKAGLVSYYGPSIMAEFGEYGGMFSYTREAVEKILFDALENFEIKSSPQWSKDAVPWKEENMHLTKKMIPEMHGYEILQGHGVVTGQVLGGCVDVFPIMLNTDIWPGLEGWQDKLLFCETSEENIPPDYLLWYLRNLGAQGLFNVIKGIIVGKPKAEVFYEEYKKVYVKVLKEYHAEYLPVLYNVNIGHAEPMGLIPLGTQVTLDADQKKLFLAEAAVR